MGNRGHRQPTARRRRRTRRSHALVFVAVLLFPACGDSTEEQAVREATTTTSSTSSSTTTTALTTTTLGKATLRSTLAPSGATGGGGGTSSGTASLALDPGTGLACLDITYKNVPDGTTAHVHRMSTNEPVISFDVSPLGSGLPFRLESVTTKSCPNMEAAVMAGIIQAPAQFYLDVHSGSFPDGAMRGPLAR